MLKLDVPVGSANLHQLNNELVTAGYPYSTCHSNRHWDEQGNMTRGEFYVGVKGTLPKSQHRAISLIVAKHIARPESP